MPKLHGNELIQMSSFFPLFFMLNSNTPDDGIILWVLKE